MPKTDAIRVSDNTVENREDGSDDAVLDDPDVEDIEEELKTTGSFNMKKFREKLKTGDFITGKNSVCGSS